MLTHRPRLPRFRRCPERAACFALTDRDRAIIRQVRSHRLLRSTDISQLVGGSPQQVLRRLQRLFHHGYLDRPRAQLNSLLTGDSQALVYALGNKGRRLLESEGEPLPRPDNRRLGQLYLDHTTRIAEFMIQLEHAVRESSGLRIFTEEELAKCFARRDPFRWNVGLPTGRIGIRPDKAFALEEPDAVPAVLCLLEVDRGTMPVHRPGLARSSFRRKLLAYEATWRQNIHRSRFGFERMRVLTVAHSEARMRNLIEEARLLESGHGLFLFTTDELLRASCPLAGVWHPVPGDGVQRLLAS